MNPLFPCSCILPLRIIISGVILVSVLFSVATIGTMMTVVLAFRLGLSHINLKPVEKYVNVIAGATILFSGLAIQLLDYKPLRNRRSERQKLLLVLPKITTDDI